ncbi:MAG: XdhC family protein, partial [Myxococcota bacterium]
VEAALGVVAGGPPRTLTFSVTDAEAWGVGLACGGTVSIRVGLADPPAMRTIVDALGAARAVAWVQSLGDAPGRVVARGEADPLAAEVADALRTDVATPVERDGQQWLVCPYNPPLRLVIVGAVHIAQALASMAATAGYQVVVVDPRASFASAERFPGVTRIDEWPDDGLRALNLDPRCAVVTLTHDPKLDDPALQVALTSEVFYVGALGSTKTQQARRERLRAAGLPESALARLHAPVGLAIGARTPAEIAVSVLAQITQVLRG